MTQMLALGPIGNVFYFVDKFDEAVAWYTARLGREPVAKAEQLVAYDIGGARLTVHKRDELNTPGPAGVAAYWTVQDVDVIVAEWTKYGAKAHRGPKTVFTGERLCQMLDPFGNLFAIRQAPPVAPVSAGAKTHAIQSTELRPPPQDRIEIAELVRAADECATHRDVTKYVSLFTEFGIMDGSKGDFCGPDAIRDAVSHVWQGEAQGTLHLTTDIDIVKGRDANNAVATSTLLTVLKEPPQLLAMTPIRQQLTFIHGQWRIARRTIG